jgi:hypothetical protein
MINLVSFTLLERRGKIVRRGQRAGSANKRTFVNTHVMCKEHNIRKGKEWGNIKVSRRIVDLEISLTRITQYNPRIGVSAISGCISRTHNYHLIESVVCREADFKLAALVGPVKAIPVAVGRLRSLGGGLRVPSPYSPYSRLSQSPGPCSFMPARSTKKKAD